MRSVVYVVEGGGLFKIGTSVDVLGRLRTLQASSPVELSLVGVMDGHSFHEQALHREFGDRRRHGEWFQLSDAEVAGLVARLRPLGGFDVVGGPLFVGVPDPELEPISLD